MNKIRMPRLHVTVLCISIVLGLIACTIQGTSHRAYEPVAPNQWQKARGPVVPHDSFPRDCSLCHEGSSWHAIKKDFVFDHAKETGVALVGAHQAAECLRCHNDRGPVANFSQHGCVGSPQGTHFDCPVPVWQVVLGAVHRLLEQHGSPDPPQVPHAPAEQVPSPPPQAFPEAVQVPAPVIAETTQQPSFAQ